MTRILGERHVSIRVISQKGFGDEQGVVPVVIVTHDAKEADIADATKMIETLEANVAPVVRVRVETPD